MGVRLLPAAAAAAAESSAPHVVKGNIATPFAGPVGVVALAKYGSSSSGLQAASRQEEQVARANPPRGEEPAGAGSSSSGCCCASGVGGHPRTTGTGDALGRATSCAVAAAAAAGIRRDPRGLSLSISLSRRHCSAYWGARPL